MKKKILLEFCSMSLVYFLGAYLLYRHIDFRVNLSPLERRAGFAFAFFIWLWVLFFLRRYVLGFRRRLEEQDGLYQRCLEKLNRTYEGTLKALIAALDCRDHATWDHSLRVAAYATAMAEEMGLNKAEQEKLALAGFLHDIGKIGVPDRILLKNSKLLPEEWQAIKRHPELGYEIIHQLEFLDQAADIILLHHEHYDGSGYPMGLKGKEIPLNARIFAMADALDAMTSDRPYRAARSMEEAVAEVKSLAGKQFCPCCVQVLVNLGVEKLARIQQGVNKEGIFKFRPEDLIRCS